VDVFVQDLEAAAITGADGSVHCSSSVAWTGGRCSSSAPAAFTTAMVLEVFARDRLFHCGRGPARQPFEALRTCR
jgi:hypothetical protein